MTSIQKEDSLLPSPVQPDSLMMSLPTGLQDTNQQQAAEWPIH